MLDARGHGNGDDGIRTTVALWLSNRDEAIKKYGHISRWETGRVTDMSYLFCANSYDVSRSGYCNSAAGGACT